MKLKVLNLLILFCLLSCSNKTDRQSETNPSCEKVCYLYTRTNESGEPTDSLKICETNYETTLDFYKKEDSLSQAILGIIYINIFKIEGEKFAILIDTTTKVYKFTGKGFEKIQHINCAIGQTEIIKTKVDINSDSHADILVEIPSGGTHGTDCIFLFYNPEKKTLEYDRNSEMRNCEIDFKNKRVKSYYNWSSALFGVERYSFKKLEFYKYLRFVSNNPKFENMIERTVYGRKGNVTKIDTIVKE
ncbi:MAG: hypothetical protein U0V72_07265 [Cytophagales bacterium]